MVQAVREHDDVRGAVVEGERLGARLLVALVGDRVVGARPRERLGADLDADDVRAAAGEVAHERPVAAPDVDDDGVARGEDLVEDVAGGAGRRHGRDIIAGTRRGTPNRHDAPPWAPRPTPPTRRPCAPACARCCADFPGAYWRGLEPDRYPDAFVKAMTAAGLLAVLIPAEYGGSGLGLEQAAVILEEVNAAGGNASACHAQMYTMGTLLRHGTEAQKQRWLPRSRAARSASRPSA